MRKAALAVLLFVSGCNAASSDTGQVALTPSPSAATSALVSASAQETSSGLALKRVRILVNEAELRGGKRRGGHEAGGTGDVSMCKGGGMGKGGHVEQGPFVVDLTADAIASGKASEPLVIADVPAGAYRGSELEIEPLEATEHGRPVADPGAAFADFKDGSTVIIEGRSHGSAFTFKTSFRTEQESVTPFTVEAGKAVSLALNVDASTWFTAQDGSALDPANPEHKAAITERIRASLTIDPDAGRHHGH